MSVRAYVLKCRDNKVNYGDFRIFEEQLYVSRQRLLYTQYMDYAIRRQGKHHLIVKIIVILRRMPLYTPINAESSSGIIKTCRS